MYYCKINKYDIANGTGVRVSLFVSGCRNHCKGCFNPETWDFKYGKRFEGSAIREILDALKPDHIAGLSILGGDPFEPENIEAIEKLCVFVRSYYPDKTIWIYTGYRFEDHKDRYIMQLIDVLVDGRFVEALKDIRLTFRGSSNQRIIDVPASLSAGRTILKQDY